MNGQKKREFRLFGWWVLVLAAVGAIVNGTVIGTLIAEESGHPWVGVGFGALAGVFAGVFIFFFFVVADLIRQTITGKGAPSRGRPYGSGGPHYGDGGAYGFGGGGGGGDGGSGASGADGG